MTQPDLSALEGLSVEDKLELLELLELRDRRKRENWLQAYRPYAKQREFHETGAVARERLFMAGNQLGKTYSGAAEVAFHVTGLYPDWWTGYRFRRPTRWIVGSESAELTRKGIQRLLLGSPEKREEWGTGAIPKSHVKGWSMKPGVPDAVSSITVKNEYGGESVIQFNSYDQGRTKWQADTLDGVWMDEEPPIDVYSEALTRTNATGGLLFITFTPLLGMSLVVKRFLKEKPAGTAVISMTIDDVEHYTPEQRAAIIAGYPEHEREARARGIPMMGSGQVFPIAESAIRVEPFQIPPHWARINGIDFGIDHPAAFACLAHDRDIACLAHDRDTDTVYLYDGWRMKGKGAAEQAMVVMAKGQNRVPWAWPHDGLQRDKGAGQVLYKQYAGFGMNMLAEPDVRAHADAQAACVLDGDRLLRGDAPVPPQGRGDRQGGRRFDFGDSVCSHDASSCPDDERDRRGRSETRPSGRRLHAGPVLRGSGRACGLLRCTRWGAYPLACRGAMVAPRRPALRRSPPPFSGPETWTNRNGTTSRTVTLSPRS